MADQASSKTASRPSRVEVETAADSPFARSDPTAGKRGKGKGETKYSVTIARSEARRRKSYEPERSIPFPLLPMTLYPFLSFRRFAKVVAQQNANRNCHSIAHRRKEVQLAHSCNRCMVQAKPCPAGNFNTGYLAIRVQVYEHIDHCFSLCTRSSFRVRRNQTAIRSRQTKSFGLGAFIVVRRRFNNRGLLINYQPALALFILLRAS